MSRRVGIVTLNGFYNYGNRLQNFALTRTIEKLGYDVKTIWSGEEIDLKRKIQYFIIKFFPFNKKWKRERKFWKFNKKYIKSINYSNKIDNFFDIYEDNGKKIILKRKDVNLNKHDYFWEFSLGKNKKISDKDFVQSEIKKGDVQEWQKIVMNTGWLKE